MINNNTINSNNMDGLLLSHSSSDNFIINNNVSSNKRHGIELYSICDDNIIYNNTANSNGGSGIYLEGNSDSNIISNNTANSNNGCGIWVDGSCYNIILNNTASNNSQGIYLDGWWLQNSNGNTIINNTLMNNSYGINVQESSWNVIKNNTLVKGGIIISGNLENWVTNNIDYSNYVNGKPIYFKKNQTNGKVPPGVGQVILANCGNMSVENQTIGEVTFGIQIGFSSYNTISNNTANSKNEYGILLYSSNFNSIYNNSVTNCTYGIFLRRSGSNIIINNNFSNNSRGIFLYDSCSNNKISFNKASNNNDCGFYIGCSSNTISNNNASTNNCGILISANSNKITNNTVISNGWGILISSPSTTNPSSNNNISNNAVINNSKGIHLEYSVSNIISNNCVANNDRWGILSESSSNIISNNIVSNSEYGIYIQGSSNNIFNNNASNNDYGVYIRSGYSSSRSNSIFKNIISNNLHGIYLKNYFSPTTSNSIYHNEIINNTEQAYDEDGFNKWDNGYPIGGNFWSDFTSVDDMNGAGQDMNGSDGIGDSPYMNIGGGKFAQDNYPLMTPEDAKDRSTPLSKLNVEMSYWCNLSHIEIETSANDIRSGLGNVELWYRHSVDNTTWGSWSLFGADLEEPFVWNYTWPLGDGYYEMYSIATDNAGNREEIPTLADIILGFDGTAPSADAGPNQNIHEGAIVIFNGSGSTDNIGIMNYTWSFWDLEMITLCGDSSTYQFNNPGIFQIILNVTDVAGNWDVDTIIVTVVDITRPIANAGLDITIDEGIELVFDGSGCVDNVGAANYTWTFTDGDQVILYGIGPRYVFRNPGIFTITLNVTDGAGNWQIDTITVTVKDITKPLADAGSDIIVDEDQKVIFNGSSSTDNVGIVSFTWTFTDEGPVVLYGIAPEYIFSDPGVFIVTLSVTDSAGNWHTDEMTVTVRDITDPVAEAFENVHLDEGTQLTFDGSGSTDNVGITNWTWTFFDDGELVLYGVRPDYVFNSPGSYVVTLNVTDDAGNWDTDVIIVEVNDITSPVAKAGDDMIVQVETMVLFDGSLSTDNFGIESYVWTFVYNGEEITLQGKNANFTFQIAGVYEVLLSVRDEYLNIGEDSVIITVVDTGIVNGIVLDADGNSVEGAKVDITTSNENTYTTTTGSDGSFSIEILYGDFTWAISKDGYKTISGTGSVSAMGEVQIDLSDHPMIEEESHRSNFILFIIVGILLVLIIGVVLFFFLVRKKGSSKEPEVPEDKNAEIETKENEPMENQEPPVIQTDPPSIIEEGQSDPLSENIDDPVEIERSSPSIEEVIPQIDPEGTIKSDIDPNGGEQR